MLMTMAMIMVMLTIRNCKNAIPKTAHVDDDGKSMAMIMATTKHCTNAIRKMCAC